MVPDKGLSQSPNGIEQMFAHFEVKGGDGQELPAPVIVKGAVLMFLGNFHPATG